MKGGRDSARLAHRTRYFATREGVQLLKDDNSNLPATKKQQQYIHRLLRSFPEARELPEHEDYVTSPNRQTAFAFIEQIHEDFIEPMDGRENYLDYVANRPGVKAMGEHGLWDANGKVPSLENAIAEVAQHTGNVWTPSSCPAWLPLWTAYFETPFPESRNCKVMEAVINNTKLIRRVNIFALLILAVCVCAVAFLCKNMWLHIACTAALFLVMTVFGYWGKGLKFLVAFLISYGWLTFNVRHGINIPSPMLFTFLIELIPVFMAVYLVSQAPSGKLTAALRQLPLPSSVRLTVIVILRFVPTVASEFSDVLDAMKTRGLLLSPLQVVLHPLNTFEYVVVPMVFRSLKIADELAASSVVRGIESPYKKEGYYLNKMAVSDGVMIALFISTAAMCILV